MDLLTVHRPTPGSIAGIGRRAPFRALGLALAVVLLASLLAPLAGSSLSAAAADDPAATDETAVATQDDGGQGDGDATATETPVAEETPVADGTTDAALTGEYFARIVVFMRTCTDRYNDVFTQLDANCGGAPEGHTFDVYGVDNYGQGIQQSGTAYLDVSGIYGGNYKIRSFTPNGYQSPVVFCSRGAGPNPQGPMTEVVTYDGYYEFSIVDTERIACHWFYVPQGPAPTYGYGSFKLGFATCPPEEQVPLPSFSYATATISELATVCSLYRDSAVSFSLTSAVTGNTVTAAVEPAQNGSATWSWMPEGGANLTSVDWPSFETPRVFCYYTDDQANIFEASVSGRNASVTIRADVLLVCDWFEIPAPASLPGGAVAVAVHLCDGIFDDGLDPYTAERDQLIAACQPYTGDQVTFELDHQVTGETTARSTGATGDGAALWEGVIGGELEITEIAGLDGYDDPVAFCYTYDPRALVLETVWAPVDIQNLGFDYELFEDFSLYCDWFNIPDADNVSDPNTEEGADPDTDSGNGTDTDSEDGTDTIDETGHLAIYKYFCPQEAELDYDDADPTELQEACEYYSGPDVRFDLYHDETGKTETRYTGDESCDLEACWREVPGGDVTITESAWEGYDEPVAFCGIPRLDDSVDFFEIDADDWSVDFEFPAGKTVLCYWFNIPSEDGHDTDGGQDEDGGTIVVTKWVCPAGQEAYELSLDELYERCDDVKSGVGFFLYGPAAGWQDVTNADGQATFGPLPAGDYRLSEDLPAGYGEPIVYCWMNVGDGSIGYETAPERVEVGGQNETGIGVELKSGTTWFCDWFNVPVEKKQKNDKHGQTMLGQTGKAESRRLLLAA